MFWKISLLISMINEVSVLLVTDNFFSTKNLLITLFYFFLDFTMELVQVIVLVYTWNFRVFYEVMSQQFSFFSWKKKTLCVHSHFTMLPDTILFTHSYFQARDCYVEYCAFCCFTDSITRAKHVCNDSNKIIFCHRFQLRRNWKQRFFFAYYFSLCVA